MNLHICCSCNLQDGQSRCVLCAQHQAASGSEAHLEKDPALSFMASIYTVYALQIYSLVDSSCQCQRLLHVVHLLPLTQLLN